MCKFKENVFLIGACECFENYRFIELSTLAVQLGICTLLCLRNAEFSDMTRGYTFFSTIINL